MDWPSIVDAILTAASAAVLVGLYGIVTTQGFDVFSADWVAIGKQMTNLGVIAAVVSLGKDFLSTKEGSLLNVGPENPVK